MTADRRRLSAKIREKMEEKEFQLELDRAIAESLQYYDHELISDSKSTTAITKRDTDHEMNALEKAFFTNENIFKDVKDSPKPIPKKTQPKEEKSWLGTYCRKPNNDIANKTSTSTQISTHSKPKDKATVPQHSTITASRHNKTTGKPGNSNPNSLTSVISNVKNSLCCAECNGLLSGTYKTALGKNFHPNCFRCHGCQELIDGSFSYKEETLDYYHPHCYKELFFPRCCLCSHTLDGKYLTHSFFKDEKFCLSHEKNWTKCFACGRREPSRQKSHKKNDHSEFVDLLDGRSLCHICSSSVIMDSSEAHALYLQAVDFMECVLNLTIPEAMREVPVLAVDVNELNEQFQSNNPQRPSGNYHHSNGRLRFNRMSNEQPIIRGLTLSRQAVIQHVNHGGFALNTNNLNTSLTRIFEYIPSTVELREVREVTAVLILYGLPRDLAASILAHEATHVWMKLTARIPFELPAKVCEGLCQYVAYEFLTQLTAEDEITQSKSQQQQQQRKHNTDSHDREQREFFQHQIRTDPSVEYGDGFREVAAAVSTLGDLMLVIDYIAEHRQLPQV